MHVNSVMTETSTFIGAGGELSLCKTHTLKAAVMQTAQSELKCLDAQGERWDTQKELADSSILSCILVSREVNFQELVLKFYTKGNILGLKYCPFREFFCNAAQT